LSLIDSPSGLDLLQNSLKKVFGVKTPAKTSKLDAFRPPD